MVIPDSIEPYVGWKALRIGNNGLLYSPQQETCWPAQRKLEATCILHGHNAYLYTPETYEWVLREGSPPDGHGYTPGRLSDEYWKGVNATTAATWHVPNTPFGGEPPTGIYVVPFGSFNVPMPPDELPPEGHFWSWEVVRSEPEWRPGKPIADRSCSCGIYAVDDLRGTLPYLVYPNTIVAKVALWGRTVVANKGARGEFAYPQKLFFPAKFKRRAPEIAERYGIPYEIGGLKVWSQVKPKSAAPSHKQRLRRSSILSAATSALMFVQAGMYAFFGSAWSAVLGALGGVFLATSIIELRRAKNLTKS